MDQAAYFRSHPPRCLDGFVTRVAELPNAQFDGHASLSQLQFEAPPGVTIEAPEHMNPVFALACKCGGASHYVHGYQWTNIDFDNAVVFLSPLVLECSACSAKTNLLDTDIHGYDGELGHGSTTVRGEGQPFVFQCETCGRQPFEIFVRLEYPDDLFDDDFPEAKGREQDLFTWFTLLGRCQQCSRLLTITDFECA